MKDIIQNSSKMTSKDLARMLGVSQSTVSRALNDNPSISEETRTLIKAKAKECGFILNSQAQSLKTSKTGIIGILFPLYFESLIKNMAFTRIIDFLQVELVSNNYEVMILYDCSATQENNVLERTIKGNKVDGIINLRPFLSEAELRLIREYKCPVVSLFYAEQQDLTLNQFRVDEYSTGFSVGEFYSNFPDRKNCALMLTMSSNNARTRLKGFIDGLGSNKIDKVFTCELSMKDSYQLVIDNLEYFTDEPCNIYVYNDIMAIGMIRALRDNGITIPEQVQIIGTDDIPMATWLPPYLSTLHTPFDTMVQHACAKLYDLIDSNTSTSTVELYKLDLIHRDTTLPL